MKKFLWLVIGIPAAVLLIVFSVANRSPVVMSLDPFNSRNPAFAVELPFFVFLFVAVFAGMAIGGLAVWFSQHRHRKQARREKARAETLEKQAKESENQSFLPASRDRAA